MNVKLKTLKLLTFKVSFNYIDLSVTVLDVLNVASKQTFLLNHYMNAPKATIFSLFLLLFNWSGQGADSNPPGLMTYQGYLTDSNGVPLGNSAPANYDVVFRIYNVKEGGGAANALWTEQQTVTVDKGYFSILLGEGSQFGSWAHGDLSDVFTGGTASDRFVELTVMDVGGSDVVIAPRLRLVSSPYSQLAQHARSADTIVGYDNGAAQDILKAVGTQLGVGLSSGANPSAKLDVNGDIRGRGDLTLNQNAHVAQKLSVGKLTTASGALDVVGDLNVEGAFSLDGSMALEGTTSLRAASTSDISLSLHPKTGIPDYAMQFSMLQDKAVINTTAGSSVPLSIEFSGSTAVKISSNGDVESSGGQFIGHGTIPIGGIIMWSGSVGNVPSGWSICDGSNSTPDLRGRFIVGAGGAYNVAAKGGAATVTLTQAQTPLKNHSHAFSYEDRFDTDKNIGNRYSYESGDWEEAGDGAWGRNYRIMNSTTSNAGNSSATPHENRPPYYALAFIMRVE